MYMHTTKNITLLCNYVTASPKPESALYKYMYMYIHIDFVLVTDP